ncbi:MAG: serine hydrolase [Actinomycetota bacterium]|nr:serine hydrolase [Actinomycetota bacterium]
MPIFAPTLLVDSGLPHQADGPPSEEELRHRIAHVAALDPTRRTRTTAAQMVEMLRAIWRAQAASTDTCRRVRDAMGRQLVMTKIASGFDSTVKVAAKTGVLFGRPQRGRSGHIP